MPTYDYRCTACGREVEVMHGIYDSGPATCEHCGGAMRKALSSPAIHFKGSGWAKKDAAASSKKSKPKSDSASDKPAAKSDGDKTSSTEASATGDSSAKAGSTSESTSKSASTTGTTSD